MLGIVTERKDFRSVFDESVWDADAGRSGQAWRVA